jgi:predicted aspartyl protease
VPATIDTHERLTIDVAIEGRGPFRFVVDTGADRTVVADDVAEQLFLQKGHRVLVEGIVRTIPAGTVLARSLSFGPVEKSDLMLPTLPRALIGCDGYLGLDVIDGYSVTLDFFRRALRVDYPAPLVDVRLVSSKLARVRASGPYGHLRSVNCDVDGVSATAFIDTGAQVTIGNPALLSALRRAGASHADLGSLPVTGVTGGSIDGEVTAIEQVRLRSVSFKIGYIVIAGLQIFELWGLSDTPALLVGMNYLRRFNRVTVDYGRKEFLFELAHLPRLETA